MKIVRRTFLKGLVGAALVPKLPAAKETKKVPDTDFGTEKEYKWVSETISLIPYRTCATSDCVVDNQALFAYMSRSAFPATT